MKVSELVKKQLEELKNKHKNAKPGEMIPMKSRINMREGIESFNNPRNQKTGTFRRRTAHK